MMMSGGRERPSLPVTFQSGDFLKEPQETFPLISLACPPITETTSGRVDGVPDRPTRPQSHPGGTAAPEDLTIVPSNPGVQEGCWRLIIKALLLSLCALTYAVRFIDAPFFLSGYCFISINDVMPGV